MDSNPASSSTPSNAPYTTRSMAQAPTQSLEAPPFPFFLENTPCLPCAPLPMSQHHHGEQPVRPEHYGPDQWRLCRHVVGLQRERRRHQQRCRARPGVQCQRSQVRRRISRQLHHGERPVLPLGHGPDHWRLCRHVDGQQPERRRHQRLCRARPGVRCQRKQVRQRIPRQLHHGEQPVKPEHYGPDQWRLCRHVGGLQPERRRHQRLCRARPGVRCQRKQVRRRIPRQHHHD